MKILNILTIAIVFMSTPAYSENNASADTTQAKQTTNSPTHKILQPPGEIDALVQNELKEGRWELVMFWATYCPVCKRDFEKIAKFIEENPELPFTAIGVVVDGD